MTSDEIDLRRKQAPLRSTVPAKGINVTVTCTGDHPRATTRP